jgi:hypothetical protein
MPRGGQFLVSSGGQLFMSPDNSSYIQYILHHLQTSAAITKLLEEALRVSRRLIIVEEINGDRTDVARAR